MPTPLFDHFGALAPWYDRLIRPADPTRLLALLALSPGLRVLDVGGGTGRVTQTLRATGAALTIVDPAAEMLRQALAKGCCRPCQSVAEALPFASASFPRLLAVDSFHHFHQQRQAAAELWRVLAPGGRIVIEEPNIVRWSVKLIALGETLLLMRSHFYRPDELARLFQELGARVTLHGEDEVNYWLVAEK